MAPAVKMAGSSPERDSVDSDSGMRVLGAVQINIGILVFVLGVVDLILTMTSYDRDLKSYGWHYHTVVTLTTLSSPLWSGLWFSITGALAACFSYGRPTTVLYSKMALVVTSLLCCALFGPACAVINGFISYTRHNLAKGDYQWLISLIVCFLAVLEVVMATVTSSVTCCCSTFSSTQLI
ncbi:unnamed protein product [Candidula unifasciata]|uniref:Uncharacterized protein n=1 Tax=Candidula unifasciata TaxID=100452 RepID=A0A8S4AC52_9EUPU|nr:unnamed protein product [Candidula unifasciata]